MPATVPAEISKVLASDIVPSDLLANEKNTFGQLHFLYKKDLGLLALPFLVN
ncbi:hypothetical protein SAMN05216311_103118 [Chitinophaga sp. CF418]|nr:hypothetical protein SAMN05216311_103118 [Chitinophaga sp. CF418]